MPTRRQILQLAALTPVTLAPAAWIVSSRPALAASPQVFQNPIAINAHDPVAYFTEGRPVRGNAAHAVNWNGATWHFANAQNAATFSANPTTYAPVFGGYCAFAASRGYLADTIPEAWTVYQGQLYLNASLRARELWLRDISGNIAAGLRNWPGILG